MKLCFDRCCYDYFSFFSPTGKNAIDQIASDKNCIKNRTSMTPSGEKSTNSPIVTLIVRPLYTRPYIGFDQECSSRFVPEHLLSMKKVLC